MTSGSCGVCRFFLGEQSACGRYPPVGSVILLPQRTLSGDVLVPTPFSVWPSVQKEQVCGEFSSALQH